MKLFFRIVFFIVLVHSAAAQHYEVISDAGDGDAFAREMESRFKEYNRLFRFDPLEGPPPLRVRLIRDRAAYDEYVAARLGSVRAGAVYLHYNQADRRELVINRGSLEEKQALPYQAFVQYLRAFIPNPPSWMREGFAIYFSTLDVSPEGKLIHGENLAWLETVKKMGSRTPTLESILRADMQGFDLQKIDQQGSNQRGVPENFQSVSWSLVSFFLNSGNEEYFRSLVESFMLLSKTATAAQNSEAVAKRIESWNYVEDMNRDYHSYLASRQTFTELMDNGQRAYAVNDTVTAERAFYDALDRTPTHYAPYYYLGLIAYGKREFDSAEHYYRDAMRFGADRALVLYAMGLNAALAGRSSDAIGFLRQAVEIAPDRYRDQAENIIYRLQM